MDEAEKLSDDLLVMAEGRSVAHGSPHAVLGDLVGEHVLVVPPDSPDKGAITAWLGENVGRAPATVLRELRAPVTTEQLSRLGERFAGTRFQVRPPNLDDLFLELSVELDPDRDEAAT
jgi:ABC-type uncharacterized transport system ATPase subunit